MPLEAILSCQSPLNLFKSALKLPEASRKHFLLPEAIICLTMTVKILNTNGIRIIISLNLLLIIFLILLISH